MTKLAAIPRTSLGFFPTPVMELRRLSQALGGPRILVKRDDQTGLAFGGNKTRKLEFLVADALSRHCDTLITAGALQSNHCRQTAAAARAMGMECHLVLGGRQDNGPPDGNLLLDHLLGATIHYAGVQRKGEPISDIADTLRKKGRNPYVIPYGGSNGIGALGFVAAMLELEEQLKGALPDVVVIASSSGGTQAGMAVGRRLINFRGTILGIGIDKGEAGDLPFENRLAEIANGLGERLNNGEAFTEDDFSVCREYTGDGYGVVGTLEREAILLMARQEGILLDPVYTGRAFGGLIDLIRKGELHSSQTVLFWHTGGGPALFSYREELFEGGIYD